MYKNINDVIEQYNILTSRLDEVVKEEKEVNSVREKLSLDYKMYDDAYESADNHFNKIENRINERKEKYAIKKCSNYMLLIGGSVTLLALICYINLGLIAKSFSVLYSSCLWGGIASLISFQLFWKKIKEKSYEKFEELESTKRSRDVADKAYVEKLKAEKELREVNGKIIDNTKKINQIKNKKRSLESEITALKVNAFDSVIQQNTKENDNIKLILK